MKKTKIQLMQGDCLERMKEIPEGSVDMVLTDPPYGVLKCKWDTVIPFDKMWNELKRIGKENCAFVFNSQQPFTTSLIMSNQDWFRYCFVWEKERATGFQNSNKMPMKKHEDIIVFYKKLPYYDSQGEKMPKPFRRKIHPTPSESAYCSDTLCTGKKPVYRTYTHFKKHTILKFNRDHNIGGRLHPTQKPVPLLKYLIETYTQEGETVLDFTMGSGSTGVACIKSNRSFIGIELNEKYFNVAKERLNEEN